MSSLIRHTVHAARLLVHPVGLWREHRRLALALIGVFVFVVASVTRR